MNLQRTLLHLETRLPTGTTIRILGVQHGVAGVYHLAPFDHAYVKATLLTHPSEVLAEGLTEQLIVPPRYGPHRLEPTWIKDMHAVKRVVGHIRQRLGLEPLVWKPFKLRRIAQNAGALLRRAASHVLLPLFARRHAEIVTRPLTERQDALAFEDAVRHTGISVSDFALVDKPRSLFMAATALEAALHSQNDQLAVAGGAHASAIHRFLEKPQTALDYVFELRQKARENPEYYEGLKLEHLTFAENVFRRHPALAPTGKAKRKTG